MNFKRMRATYDEFPRTFWVLIGSSFIDRLGGALLFPFFALYITQRFGVGMTQVGVLFTIFSAASMVGGMFSGALTDKFGRRWMIIFGLVASASTSLAMGFSDDLKVFYLLAGVAGLLANVGNPARQAMIADLLPTKEKRAEGYGILRVAANLAVALGPALGGLLAAWSYLLLFVMDAVTSVITAVIVYLALPETKPERAEGETEQSLAQSFSGYADVLRDVMYMAFLLVGGLSVLVYVQMNSTLSVYLRDVHGIPAQGYGYILSMNAAMVVLFQFGITRRVAKYAPMLMMALGTALYAVGFAMYGFVSGMALFMLAMVVITIGEMIAMPVAQTLAAQFAPDDMRGRYMALFGMSWVIPSALGPLLAGLIVDNYDPDWVWYAAGMVAMVAVAGYVRLSVVANRRMSVTEVGSSPQAVPVVE